MAIIYGSNYGKPSLDLNFSSNKNLIDSISGRNLITFQRSHRSSYIDSDGKIKYADINEPRFEYDPVTGESLGLLIEDSRTNRILYSDLRNWTSEPTKTYETGITGVFSESFSFAPTRIGDEAGRIYSVSLFGIVNTNDIVSVYVKLKTYISGDPSISFRLGTEGSQAHFRLISKTMSTSGFSWSNPGYVDMGNGWYRFFAKCIATDTSPRVRIYLGDSGILNNTTIGTEIYLNGFQSEAGSFPSSYIPTGGVSVTRPADDVQITGSNFSSWYNQNEGTVFCNAKNVPFGGGLWYFGPGVSPRWWTRYELTNGIRTQAFDGVGGSGVVDLTIPGLSGNVTTDIKHAVSISSILQQHSGAVNGGSVGIGSWDSISGVSSIKFGHRVDLGTNIGFLNGHISHFTYYPKYLSNSSLQSITK